MDCIMFLNILCSRTAKFKSFRILMMSTFIKIDRKIRNLKIKRHYRVKKKKKKRKKRGQGYLASGLSSFKVSLSRVSVKGLFNFLLKIYRHIWKAIVMKSSPDWHYISHWDCFPNLHIWETWELSGHAAEQSATMCSAHTENGGGLLHTGGLSGTVCHG